MTHTERKLLHHYVERADLDGVENLLIRAEHASTVRKMRRIEKQFRRIERTRQTLSMRQFWAGADQYGGNF